jgi:hypothetical protein
VLLSDGEPAFRTGGITGTFYILSQHPHPASRLLPEESQVLEMIKEQVKKQMQEIAEQT